jgi:hypothetical protein
MLAAEIIIGVLLFVILIGFTLMVAPPNAWLSRRKKK